MAQHAEADEKGKYIPFEGYKMKHKERGYALIINNRCFDKANELSELKNTGIQLKERIGTHMDNKRMILLLKNELGFKKFKKVHDATKEEMIELFTNAASENYTDMDCFICVLMTYATVDPGYIWATDGKVELKSLMEPFKGKPHQASKTLIGKPKIFFIQTEVAGLPHDAVVEEPIYSNLPTEADFFISQSSFAYQSEEHRGKPYNIKDCQILREHSLDEEEGSWFIHSLHQVIKANYQKDDLVSMVTKAICKVAEHINKYQKPMYPMMKSMLTKQLFFEKQ